MSVHLPVVGEYVAADSDGTVMANSNHSPTVNGSELPNVATCVAKSPSSGGMAFSIQYVANSDSVILREQEV